jgi:choice-of-anchor B domain-containing protein
MKNLLTILIIFVCFYGDLTGQQSSNMTLLGNWDDNALPRYSDVWGYAAPDGREYALIGSRNFIHVLDVTNPTVSIDEIARLNTFTDSGSTWRDIKVMGHYAYCVTETSEGLQVIDLGDLPNTASIVFQTNTAFSNCHNVILDSLSSPPKLYMLGTNTGAERDGYIVYSLADPANPTLLGSFNLTSGAFMGGYLHDGYVIRDTLYANHEGRGMYAYDVSDWSAPTELGQLDGYVEEGYNHSCGRTDNGNIMVMCDETTDTGVKVVDISDPMDMQVISVFRSTLNAPDLRSLAHNPYVMGDSLVVLSYYGDGVQVWDIRDPANPRRLAYYDTTPGSSSYTNGIWGAYPWLPSGNILGSDMENGLFVLSVNNYDALPVEYLNWSAESDGKHSQLSWSTSEETDNLGWEVEHAVSRGAFVSVGFVEASEGAYAFTHETPGEGLHYYRLRQRDYDGTENLSEVKTVLFTGSEDQVSVYPNPARAGTSIRLQGLTPGADWTLSNLEGKRIYSGQGQTIPGRSLSPGVYFLKTEGKVVGKVVVAE